MNRASTYVLYDGKQIIDHPVSALRSHPDIPVNTNKGDPNLISPRPTISLAQRRESFSHSKSLRSFSCGASQHDRRFPQNNPNKSKRRGSFSQLMKQRCEQGSSIRKLRHRNSFTEQNKTCDNDHDDDENNSTTSSKIKCNMFANFKQRCGESMRNLRQISLTSHSTASQSSINTMLNACDNVTSNSNTTASLTTTAADSNSFRSVPTLRCVMKQSKNSIIDDESRHGRRGNLFPVDEAQDDDTPPTTIVSLINVHDYPISFHIIPATSSKHKRSQQYSSKMMLDKYLIVPDMGVVQPKTSVDVTISMVDNARHALLQRYHKLGLFSSDHNDLEDFIGRDKFCILSCRIMPLYYSSLKKVDSSKAAYDVHRDVEFDDCDGRRVMNSYQERYLNEMWWHVKELQRNEKRTGHAAWPLVKKVVSIRQPIVVVKDNPDLASSCYESCYSTQSSIDNDDDVHVHVDEARVVEEEALTLSKHNAVEAKFISSRSAGEMPKIRIEVQ